MEGWNKVREVSVAIPKIARFKAKAAISAGSSGKAYYMFYSQRPTSSTLETTSLEETLYEVTGASSYAVDDIVYAWWAADAQRWEIIATGGSSWKYCELTADLAAGEAAAKILNDDQTESGDTCTVKDPVGMYAGLTTGTVVRAEERTDGNYHILQSECPV